MSKEIVPAGSSQYLAVLCALLGIACPVLGVVAGGLGAVAGVIEHHTRRREERRYQRLRRTVALLESRLGDDTADDPAPEATIDLFLEVAKKLAEDDEDDKYFFYAGVLEWIRRGHPNPAPVRVLSSAVQALSYEELVFFITELKGLNGTTRLEKHLPEAIGTSRLISFGLLPSGTRHKRMATSIGTILSKYCRYEDLAAHEQRLPADNET